MENLTSKRKETLSTLMFMVNSDMLPHFSSVTPFLGLVVRNRPSPTLPSRSERSRVKSQRERGQRLQRAQELQGQDAVVRSSVLKGSVLFPPHCTNRKKSDVFPIVRKRKKRPGNAWEGLCVTRRRHRRPNGKEGNTSSPPEGGLERAHVQGPAKT